jgi:uncharacterized protein
MSTIYIMEAANLFVGLADPTKSKHLTLTELKLPALQEIFVDHHGGGMRVGIEVGVGVQKLEPTFNLAGFDPDLLSEFGLGSKVRNVFTAYGVVRDKRTGRAIEAKAIMEGRLGKADMSAFQRGEMTSFEYAINELMHYELWFDGAEKIHWDAFTNVWRINGVDENSAENLILRIPQTGA